MSNMEVWIVSCASCDLRWDRVGNMSEYERQAVESHPCPRCGAYTLSCREPHSVLGRGHHWRDFDRRKAA